MRSIGKIYEEKACEYLRQKGYKILERNFNIRGGELDIIAEDGKYLIFVEVKERKNTDYGYPSEFVNKTKQQRMVKTAIFYIKQKNIKKKDIRFDVVSIIDRDGKIEIEHIQNAFNAEGYYF